MKEEFYRVFTDDPVNWVKWAVVFAVLILGYVVAIPLYRKVSYRLSWERKRDIARSRNHVLKAKLVMVGAMVALMTEVIPKTSPKSAPYFVPIVQAHTITGTCNKVALNTPIRR